MITKRFFNTTGPCNPDDHYMLSPQERLVGAQLDRYIRNKLYWVLHAPHQVGKTTFLQSWVREINAGGGAVACYESVEDCQEINGYHHIIEIKLVRDHDNPQIIREEGLEQVRGYRDKFAPGTLAYLVIFDGRTKTKEKSWDERIKWEKDGDVIVLGC